ncbi:GGDEF domain-containing protein [Sphingosinicellaceae bacterium]|nr:GGDEF domain-containing protein [Sphingosinicellaceae bacterium]
MLVIAYEADRSDAVRAREAVARTFTGMLTRLDSAVAMNAGTPQIAGSLSGQRAKPDSAYGYFNFTLSEALGYYGTIVLNQDGSAFAGTHLGLPWTGPALVEAARIVAPIAARLPMRGASTVHALVRDKSGQVLAIAVANVASSSSEAASGAVAPPRRLAIIAPVGLQVMPKMLPSLDVEDFRIAAAGRDGNAVTIPVENGPPIVFTWRPRTPGRAAIGRWAPAIGILLLAALIMLTLAGRMSMAATRALERLAHHDSLTGLANRAAFRDELDRRLGHGEAVALGLIDLNGFKSVNDQYGHPVGDGLLQAVAAELAGSANPGDFVARLGGDEFAWLCSSHTAALRLSEAFADRIARPFSVDGISLQIGAAVGIAVAHAGLTATALMAVADARLYESKPISRHAGVAGSDSLRPVEI